MMLDIKFAFLSIIILVHVIFMATAEANRPTDLCWLNSHGLYQSLVTSDMFMVMLDTIMPETGI